MAKKASKGFKVVIRCVPCDPSEWEDTLDVLAGLMAQACLEGKMNGGEKAAQDGDRWFPWHPLEKPLT